jgi:hypothetical protein
VCFWVVVWFFGAVFEWAFGCQRACGVCSRLLEMADVSPLAREAGEGGNLWQGAPPCAPTPLSHRVGEGLGVRANKRALPAYRTQAMYPCQGGSRGERLFALACFVEGVETGWEQQGAPLSTTCALSGV